MPPSPRRRFTPLLSSSYVLPALLALNAFVGASSLPIASSSGVSSRYGCELASSGLSGAGSMSVGVLAGETTGGGSVASANAVGGGSAVSAAGVAATTPLATLSLNTGRVLAVATASAAATSANVNAYVIVEASTSDSTAATTTRSRTASSSSLSSSSTSRTTSALLSSTPSVTYNRTSISTPSPVATARVVVTTTPYFRNSTASLLSSSSKLRTTTRKTSHTSSSTTASRKTTTTRKASTHHYTTSTSSRKKTTTTSKETTSTKKATSTKKSSSKTSTKSSSAAKASPTSYSSVKSASCVEPPTTFSGTEAGYSTLCTVRYCDALPSYNMYWNGNDGNVTRKEIETALGMLGLVGPVWEDGPVTGNILADGALGQALYNAGLMLEITGDIRALDIVVRLADNILSLQNQNSPDPVVIWTGEVDPVWPTGPLHPTAPVLVYAGSENGLIAGGMISAAVMILKSPCLWEMIPPASSGPTMFNDTATYYDRALAYIAAGDDIYENYFFRFLDPNLSIIQPADGRWDLTGDTRVSGTPMPWNRRMMILHGYMRLAAAHETSAAFNATLTARYDQIVQVNVQEFFADLNQTTAVRNGATTFDWDHSAGEDHTEESQGVHAFYDVWGSFLAWQRSSASFGVSNYVGKTFVSTFVNTISIGNGTFSGLVTGSSTTKAYSISSLWGAWAFYSVFDDGEWYQQVATANSQIGFRGRSWMAIPLLWTKHALAMDDLTFWAGKYSSGYGVVSSTSTTTSPSTASSGASRSETLASVTVLALFVGVLVLAA